MLNLKTDDCANSKSKLDNKNREIVDKHWQTSKATVSERNEFMLNKQLLSDVEFKVGKKDGPTDIMLIPAHKYVLATASPVFYAMLFGGLAENSTAIKVDDCEADTFLEFLRFIYCDKVNLNGNNVLGILYLAKKYIIPFLVEKCVSYLMDNVTVDNVLEVLGFARCFCESKLERRCWSVLSRKTSDVISSQGFLEVNKATLQCILEKDCLSVNEIDLFDAIKKWSEKECEKLELEVNQNNQMEVLQDIINLVRFPTMTPKDFAEGPARSGLLDVDDVKNIFIYLNAGIIDGMKFSLVMRRFKYFACSRYGRTMRNYLWRYDEKDIDSIKFKVDEEIYFAGIGLYGSPCGGEYSLQVVLSLDDEVVWVEEKLFTCPPDPDIDDSDSPQTHDVIFEEPVKLRENVFYTISATIGGPPSFAGDFGKSEVVMEGVKFNFENSGESSNGTSFDEGQIPSLLFHF